jgi:hypothetical protein
LLLSADYSRINDDGSEKSYRGGDEQTTRLGYGYRKEVITNRLKEVKWMLQSEEKNYDL